VLHTLAAPSGAGADDDLGVPAGVRVVALAPFASSRAVAVRHTGGYGLALHLHLDWFYCAFRYLLHVYVLLQLCLLRAVGL